MFVPNKKHMTMENTKPHLTIRVIYWISRLAHWLMALTLFLAIVLSSLLHLNVIGEGLELHTNLPNKVDLVEQGELHLKSGTIQVEFVEAMGKLHLINTPPYIVKRLTLVIIILGAASFFMTLQFKNFMISVHKGLIFTTENIKNLKRIAYTLAGFWFITVLYSHIFYYTIIRHLDFNDIAMTSDVPNYPMILMAALFLWMIAHIFGKGVELQEEKDLTI